MESVLDRKKHQRGTLVNVERACEKMSRKIDLAKERDFENSKMTSVLVRQNQSKFNWAVRLKTDEHSSFVKTFLPSKKVIEIGCSAGQFAEQIALLASSYVGVDVSDKAIAVAVEKNLPNAAFRVLDAHRLDYSDGQFDIMIVNSLLHHLDLSVALPEFNRVLCSRGILLFREPLGGNLLMNLYRTITPSSRTPDERPLTKEDLELFSKYFCIEEATYVGFSNLISSVIRLNILRKVLTAVDEIVAKTFLRKYYWQIMGAAVKKEIS